MKPRTNKAKRKQMQKNPFTFVLEVQTEHYALFPVMLVMKTRYHERAVSVVETIDHEESHLIFSCLNCI